MQILLIIVGILIIAEIKSYIKIKDLEKRTERTFVEVEKDLNVLERRIKRCE